ncbi:hypothetical protein AB0D57_46660 [Streptomyces sp. NPDC048275]|uniref:hypothetical protein n=1 Tax=Streptomyces sp. NPDC048275 TaxID=3155629 RepID=UPI0033DA9921
MRWWGLLQDWTVGYGYRPLRAAVWLLFLLLAGGEQEEEDGAWVALIPGDFPARLFAQTELFHLVSGIAWLGAHHRDYGSAKVAHNACHPVGHTDRPDSSRGAGELWQAMRLRMARGTHQLPHR